MRFSVCTFQMDFLEELLVHSIEWSVLCTVRQETLIDILLLKSAKSALMPLKKCPMNI